MSDLTPAQASVLTFIERHQAEHQRPPTRQEIALAMGWKSPNAAQEHIAALQRKGFLAVSANKSRGIFVMRAA